MEFREYIGKRVKRLAPYLTKRRSGSPSEDVFWWQAALDYKLPNVKTFDELRAYYNETQHDDYSSRYTFSYWVLQRVWRQFERARDRAANLVSTDVKLSAEMRAVLKRMGLQALHRHNGEYWIIQGDPVSFEFLEQIVNKQQKRDNQHKNKSKHNNKHELAAD